MRRKRNKVPNSAFAKLYSDEPSWMKDARRAAANGGQLTEILSGPDHGYSDEAIRNDGLPPPLK